jgi:hypothetical protein
MNLSCLRIFVSGTASISNVIFDFYENNDVRMFLSRPFLLSFISATDGTNATRCYTRNGTWMNSLARYKPWKRI